MTGRQTNRRTDKINATFNYVARPQSRVSGTGFYGSKNPTNSGRALRKGVKSKGELSFHNGYELLA